jgi:multidrug efflux pump subunit AcrA (membrane-fusion protein)
MSVIKFFLVVFIFISCREKKSFISPIESSITSSVYASGSIKSKNQYTVFPKVNGVLEHIYVSGGDTVVKGSPLFSIQGVNQMLNEENAELAASYYNLSTNKEAINEAKQSILLTSKKRINDSTFFYKNKRLFEKDLISELEFSQSELAYENSKTANSTARLKYAALLKQVTFNANQSKKNLEIAKNSSKDLTVFSTLDGVVYQVSRNQGETVTVQSDIAVIGSSNDFIIEMQVDANEIIKVKKGQKIVVAVDSYPDSSFFATVTKVNPFMDQKTRTFLVEAEFVKRPEVLYPNVDIEANIIIEEKEMALLIPREYIINDSFVILKGQDTVKVTVGLKDFNYAEVLSGLNKDALLINPFN